MSISAERGAIGRLVAIARDAAQVIRGAEVAIGNTHVRIADDVGPGLGIENPGTDEVRIQTADCEVTVTMRRN